MRGAARASPRLARAEKTGTGIIGIIRYRLDRWRGELLPVINVSWLEAVAFHASARLKSMTRDVRQLSHIQFPADVSGNERTPILRTSLAFDKSQDHKCVGSSRPLAA